MKIGVLIMSTPFNPGARNVNAFKETIVKDYIENKSEFKHEYGFYEYYCIKEVENSEYYYVCEDELMNTIVINEDESVYRTFEKTMAAFNAVSFENYDFIIRLNISTFINLRLIDRFIDNFEKDIVYCNAINAHLNGNDWKYCNELYPRGDMMIFSGELMNKIHREGLKYIYCDESLEHRIGVEHVDDCLIGACLMDVLGNDYYDHLKMLRYNFIPSVKIDENEIDKRCIGYRIKTIPPTERFSGYSWKDNVWRSSEPSKFVYLLNLEKSFSYSDIGFEDLFTGKDDSKRITGIDLIGGISVETIKEILKNKRTD